MKKVLNHLERIILMQELELPFMELLILVKTKKLKLYDILFDLIFHMVILQVLNNILSVMLLMLLELTLLNIQSLKMAYLVHHRTTFQML